MTQDPYVVPTFITFTLGMIVYFIGADLTKRFRVLREFNIPEPVSGGLFMALVMWAIVTFWSREVSFDLGIRDQLLVIFFTTIGLNARVSDLVRGGKPLVILLGLTIVFMIVQNVVGLIGATMFGLPSAASVLVGSAALIGGHGTAIAWAPELDAMGVEQAVEIGAAAATLGLISAALIGGPIARVLINRFKLEPEDADADPVVGVAYESPLQADLDYVGFMRAMVTIHIAIILGFGLHEGMNDIGLRLPLFVPCLIMGILVANLQPMLFPHLPEVRGTPVLALISEFSLSLFLAISLMNMKLWTLAGLAGPLIVILAMQVVVAVLFCLFAVFKLMGGGYRAAVLSAGFGGFALGATPTAIANMTAVTKRYGPSPLAFVILPLVSAFFVDVANAFIIQFFVGL